VDAVAFAAAATADDLLLVRPLEVEAGHVAAARHLLLAEDDVIRAAG